MAPFGGLALCLKVTSGSPEEKALGMSVVTIAATRIWFSALQFKVLRLTMYDRKDDHPTSRRRCRR
jgi:hypothetical protein